MVREKFQGYQKSKRFCELHGSLNICFCQRERECGVAWLVAAALSVHFLQPFEKLLSNLVLLTGESRFMFLNCETLD